MCVCVCVGGVCVCARAFGVHVQCVNVFTQNIVSVESLNIDY